ncbi:MAG: 4-hydroxythreonine-4-phosphate dehydrogenase PdxA [Rhodobacterales bacterium]|nr:4-hydroxythreonine-4-phosphate dehydrogenase PdxA [Rhodobacterales bacterium]
MTPAAGPPLPPSPLALTMGEPAGIGGELTLKAWRTAGCPPFVALDDPDRLGRLAETLGLDVPIAVIDDPAEAPGRFTEALPVLPVPLDVPSVPGRTDPANAGAVKESIERAVALTRAGRAAAVVTNPIHKAVLYAAGFTFPGHTEYLADLAGIDTPPVMMLACPGLRVVPVTIHVALSRAVETLTADAIYTAATITAHALGRDFGIAHPRLAVAGLNPHAGEDGAMGTEDRDIVAPAVARLKAVGINAFGPLPADTMFHERARAGYDAAICMYHDQALIPVKTLGFDLGVNITLGLPFVRTSPDHGTALDIAGTGRARPDSLLAALRQAAAMAARRAAAP